MIDRLKEYSPASDIFTDNICMLPFLLHEAILQFYISSLICLKEQVIFLNLSES